MLPKHVEIFYSPLLPHYYSPRSKGAALTHQQVLDIFRRKPLDRGTGLAAALAREFQVTPKTIREIWTGRAWSTLTLQCHTDRPRLVEPQTPSRPFSVACQGLSKSLFMPFLSRSL